MKINFNRKIIFICILVVQFLIFIFLLSRNLIIKNDSVKNNRIYTFDCTYYDPYNVLKGRYINLSMSNRNVSLSELDAESKEVLPELLENEMVYVLLKENKDHFWTITGVRNKKPRSGDFIKAKYKYKTNQMVMFDFLISEYYMQENFAQLADMKMGVLGSIKLEVYCDKNGNVLQKQLYVLENNEYYEIEQYISEQIK